MGIDRIIHDQKEKSKQEAKYQNEETIELPRDNKISNQPSDNNLKDISYINDKKKSNDTSIARSQEHQKKIDRVKDMFNLK